MRPFTYPHKQLMPLIARPLFGSNLYTLSCVDMSQHVRATSTGLSFPPTVSDAQIVEDEFDLTR